MLIIIATSYENGAAIVETEGKTFKYEVSNKSKLEINKNHLCNLIDSSESFSMEDSGLEFKNDQELFMHLSDKMLSSYNKKRIPTQDSVFLIENIPNTIIDKYISRMEERINEGRILEIDYNLINDMLNMDNIKYIDSYVNRLEKLKIKVIGEENEVIWSSI